MAEIAFRAAAAALARAAGFIAVALPRADKSHRCAIAGRATRCFFDGEQQIEERLPADERWQ